MNFVVLSFLKLPRLHVFLYICFHVLVFEMSIHSPTLLIKILFIGTNYIFELGYPSHLYIQVYAAATNQTTPKDVDVNNPPHIHINIYQYNYLSRKWPTIKIQSVSVIINAHTAPVK